MRWLAWVLHEDVNRVVEWAKGERLDTDMVDHVESRPSQYGSASHYVETGVGGRSGRAGTAVCGMKIPFASKVRFWHSHTTKINWHRCRVCSETERNAHSSGDTRDPGRVGMGDPV